MDKRIDVIAVSIRAGLTVYDLEEMELTYAPPFGSAKDPVNYAGFVASNILRGDVGIFHVEEAMKPADNQKLVDVRNPEEVAGGTIPGAKNIPLGQLREKLVDLHRLLLGEDLTTDHIEIDASYDLLLETWQEHSADYPGNAFVHGANCIAGPAWSDTSTGDDEVQIDANSMVSTWMVVMVYLMSDFYYLHE